MNIFVYPNGYVQRKGNWEGKATINFVGEHWGQCFIYRQIIIEIENMPNLNIDLELLSMIPDHHQQLLPNPWDMT